MTEEQDKGIEEDKNPRTMKVMLWIWVILLLKKTSNRLRKPTFFSPADQQNPQVHEK